MIYHAIEELKEQYRERRKQARIEGHAEGHALGRTEGRTEGRAEGRAEARAIVCRMARLKFGAGAGERLEEVVKQIMDPKRISRIGDMVIECETGDELLALTRDI